MNLEKKFKSIVILKTLLFLLIVLWGGSTQLSNEMQNGEDYYVRIGGVVFGIFSFVYLISSYFIYKKNKIGKFLFLLCVFLFVILGFFSELLTPNQFSKNLFYLFIFYIVSPIFFIVQGIVLGLIYFVNDYKILFENNDKKN